MAGLVRASFAPWATPSHAGQRVVGGRYRLIDTVGSGGMGTVWRAHDELLGRTVAVKEVSLPQELADVARTEVRERTMREARAVARLSHPNAVTVHDVIEEGGQPWIVMQLVAADSLSDVLAATGPISPQHAARIGLAVLSALEAAHAAGILHRDVKPANVLLGHDGRVVLTDFGIASLEGDPALTGTGSLLGSPAYMAPERALGRQISPASDLWSSSPELRVPASLTARVGCAAMGGHKAEGARAVGGRYRLIDRIGSGGMGTVWRAHDVLLGRAVAVKEVHLPQELAAIDRSELRLRTMREARAAARLSHPNAVTIHDVIEEDGQPWIVMQLVAAESLSDVIERNGPLPPRRVAEIGLAILGALQAAHAAGILHRDVKPANVLLGEDDRAVLTDFGVATLEGDPALTSTGLLLGSPSYIAPERALGKGAGAASDLWSLGATLYAAVEGRAPYARPTVMATLAALTTEDPPPPSASGPLADAIIGLLHREPDRRLDAPAARRLLEDAATGTTDRSATTRNIPTLAPTEAPERVDQTGVDQRPDLTRADLTRTGTPVAPPRRRRRWIATTLAVLVLLGGCAAATAAYLANRDTSSPNTPVATSSTPAAAMLPAGLVGRWSGTISETGGSKTAKVDLQLYAGTVGSLVGTSSYPDLGCSGELRLVSVNGNGAVQLAERILVQGTARRCTPTVTIDLRQLADDLGFSGSDGFAGVLSPGAPTG